MAGSLIIPHAIQEGYESVPGIAGLEIPFTQASKPVVEQGPYWTELTPTTSALRLEPKGIPSNGYLRHILVTVETEVAGEGGVGNQDFPFSLISSMTFEDQGGHPIHGPLSGFSWYLVTKHGAYFRNSDLRQLPSFNGSATAPRFTLVIPVEIAPTGLGALSNMLTDTKYHVNITLSALANAYSTLPSRAPRLRIRTEPVAWPLPQERTEPEPGAPHGRVMQQVPPLLGTVQYWTEQPAVSVVNGTNRVTLTRVGQMIRTHVFITRNNAGERVNTVLPTPLEYSWVRVRMRTQLPQSIQDMAWLAESSNATEDVGVYPFLYSCGEQRYAGANEVNGWMPTVQTTSLALEGGNWGEGKLTILTNDVAVAAVSELGRREVPGQTSEREPRGVA